MKRSLKQKYADIPEVPDITILPNLHTELKDMMILREGRLIWFIRSDGSIAALLDAALLECTRLR